MNRTLSRPERIAWARLARTPRIGPLTELELSGKAASLPGGYASSGAAFA